MIRLLCVAILLLLAANVAASAQATTVQSLLKSGFSVDATTADGGALTIMLQMRDQLYACLVDNKQETPSEFTTIWCKRVR